MLLKECGRRVMPEKLNRTWLASGSLKNTKKASSKIRADHAAVNINPSQ